MELNEILKNAKRISLEYGDLSSDTKNNVLKQMAFELLDHKEEILAANKKDLINAKGKLSDAKMDRLMLNEQRLNNMAQGILDLVSLEDPTNKILETNIRPNGLKIEKVSVAMGVIAVIYESRPNVTSDVASLIFKAGSVSVLRTSKDAYLTSYEIVKALHVALDKNKVPKEFINLVCSENHDDIQMILHANEYIDLIIPRGSKNLINQCVQNSTVPIIQTGTGICHIYVDESADLKMAQDIIENAKTSRVSVCNAQECLLVNEKIAADFLPMIKDRLVDQRIKKELVPVELRLDDVSLKYIDGSKAKDDDYGREFIDYILAVKVVKDTNEAIEFINSHSSHHSESIITENNENAEKFLNRIDSACVYVNASTRFSDGGEFGMGCEIGISTQKLHARGPMGLKEITTYKYKVYGKGQIR